MTGDGSHGIGGGLARLPVEASASDRPSALGALDRGRRLIVPLLLLAIWQLSSLFQSAVGFHLPTPTDVLVGFRELWEGGDIQTAVPASLARAGTGFACGLAIGLTLGVANGLSRLSEDLFDSTMQIIRVVPFIAAVPLFVVWFGIGEDMKLILITLACSFPVYINTLGAVKLVDKKLVEVGETFSMSRAEIILQIILPTAYPTILIGIRYALSTSLLALIVAEQVNTKSGIGHIIYIASNALRIDLIVAGIVMYAVLGLLIDLLMRTVERHSAPWLDRREAR